MQERAKELLAVTITLLVLALVTVSLRCFVRIKLVKAFGLDDYLMVASMLVFIAYCACQLTAIHYGIGSHDRDLSTPNILQAVKYQVICELLYVADAALIKLSVAFLLLRIMPENAKVYRSILFSGMTVMTLWTVVTFLIVLLQCRPFSSTWDRFSGKGKCLSSTFITNNSYAFSAMDILLDWLFALLPVPMLWDVKMSTQSKGSLLFILGLGVL
ncbi:hypothetical protein LARI1_G008800 [Lachnellula arida]|uniref:Rhodopsin domain-containing protein n=1 Tax=Lachnellula arida TaxID=1316785 RepID=A0A8T9B538_9HELO|nr:hypothetical protein LARI1_G008800 [Lachnellula arida]